MNNNDIKANKNVKDQININKAFFYFSNFYIELKLILKAFIHSVSVNVLSTCSILVHGNFKIRIYF